MGRLRRAPPRDARRSPDRRSARCGAAAPGRGLAPARPVAGRAHGPGRAAPDARKVSLTGGRTGYFKPLTCGASCSPPVIEWSQGGVLYWIQAHAGTKRQEKKRLVRWPTPRSATGRAGTSSHGRGRRSHGRALPVRRSSPSSSRGPGLGRRRRPQPVRRPGGPPARSGPARSRSSPTATRSTSTSTVTAHGSPPRVRLTGFNAMELRRYSPRASRRRGDCHGVEATARLEQLLRRGHRACGSPPRTRQPRRRRLRRQVRSRTAAAGSTPAAAARRGPRAVAPNRSSGPGTATTRRSADQAAAAGLRLWDPQGCGAGPSPARRSRCTSTATPPRDDRFNLNGEWAEIINHSAPPSGSSTGGSATPGCAATPSRPARSCPPAAPSRCAWAPARTPPTSSTGASHPAVRQRERRRPGPSATAATCSTRAATCGPGRSTTSLRAGGHADPDRLRPRARRRDGAAAGAREPGARAARRHDRARQPDARQDHRQRAAGARVRRPR